MKKHYVLFLTALYLACAITLQAQPTPDYTWYKNSVIYTLDVDTYRDSNGDGIGDFNGLTQQLDYLHGLGVTVLWLSPFQPTPDKDDGYDITDYYGIDPRLGTAGDFAEFMFQTKQRGIRVIMDLVLNHTSSQHPWFRAARQSKKSPYRDWYVWSDTRPADAEKGMVFPGIEKETWTLDSVSTAYYYHRFYTFQPDLNYANPAVVKESKRVISYWLNQGIAGFRLDAVPFILEVDKTNSDNPPHRFDQLTDLRRHVQRHSNNAIMLGEANVTPEESADYFGKADNGMQMMFNFFVNQHLFYGLATGDIKPLVTALEQTRKVPADAQWAYFLRNHDEIDLGRLTDEQREKVYKAFGPDKNMQLYDRGIRRRLAPMLHNDRRLALAYSLLFSLPGTPVIRYGDEIGMGDNLQLKERLSVRTPMQWTGEPYSGFSTTEPFRPVISSGEYSYKKLNVEAMQNDPRSLLTLTKRFIQIRKEHPALGLGTWTIVDSPAEGVLIMQYTYGQEKLLVVHNLSANKQVLKINQVGKKLINLLSAENTPIGQETITLTLEGYDYQWYQIR